MPILWTPQLAVGVAEIDEQHQELFRRVNDLLAALRAHHGREALTGLTGYLASYVGEHFAAEARLMGATGFPDGAAHLQEHAAFEAQYRALAAELERDGAASHLAVRASRLLVDWLREHVQTRDRALGAHLAGWRRPVGREHA